jgi:hypothetical protein
MDANLEFWKWSILGMYFFVEMFTIVSGAAADFQGSLAPSSFGDELI